MKKAFQWVKDREKRLLEGARRTAYKSLDGERELAIHFFLPKNLREGDPRPGALFFHGGAWDRGSVVEFAPHALHLVARGAISGLVEYRHAASHPGSTPALAQQDARAAFRYLRHHAEDFHVDPERLVGIGAGAGANLVGAAAMKAPLGPSESGHTLTDSQPSAAVLVSPILDPKRGAYGHEQCADAAEAKRMSLPRLVKSGLPPMLLLHGTGDRFVPTEDLAEFAGMMERKKNVCRLVEFEGRDRDFFNLNFDPVSFEACLDEIDAFLDECGILKKSETDPGTRLVSWREEDY